MREMKMNGRSPEQPETINKTLDTQRSMESSARERQILLYIQMSFSDNDHKD